MTIYKNPLYGFSDPLEAISKFIKGVKALSKLFVYVHGEDGAGKTLFLRTVLTNLLHHDVIVLNVDALNVTNFSPLSLITACEDLLLKIAEKQSYLAAAELKPFHALLRKATPRFYAHVKEFVIDEQRPELSEAKAFLKICSFLRQNLGKDKAIIVLIDNYDYAASSLAPFLSSVSHPLMGVITTIAHKDYSTIFEPAIHVAFDVQKIYLPPLSCIDIQKMMKNYLEEEIDLRALSQILEKLTKGNPGKLHSAMRFICERDYLSMNPRPEDSFQNIEVEVASYLDVNEITHILSRYDNEVQGAAAVIGIFGSVFQSRHLQMALGAPWEAVEFIMERFKKDRIITDAGNGYVRLASENFRQQLSMRLLNAGRCSCLLRMINAIEPQLLRDDPTLAQLFISNFKDFYSEVEILTLLDLLAACSSCFYSRRDKAGLREALEVLVEYSSLWPWEFHYGETLFNHNVCVEHSVLLRDNELTLRISESVRNKARCRSDIVNAVDAEVKVFKLNRQYYDSIKVATKYLRSIGYYISPRSTIISTLLDIVYLSFMLAFFKRPLSSLPVMQDKSILSGAKILRTLSGSAYMNAESKYFLPRLILLAMRWTIRHGIGPGTTYATYGLDLLKNILREQYPFVRLFSLDFLNLGRKTIDSFQYTEQNNFSDHYFSCRTDFVRAAFLDPLKRDIQHAITDLERNYELAFSVGDYEFSGYSSSVAGWYQLSAGFPLKSIEEKIKERRGMLDDIGDEAVLYNHDILLNLVVSLRNAGSHSSWRQDPQLARNSKFLYFLSRGWIAFVNEEYSSGYPYTQQAFRYIDGGLGLPLCCYLYIFHARFILELRPKLARFQLHYLAYKIEFWAQSNPVDYASFLNLIRYYISSFCNINGEMHRYLNEAIATSPQNNLFLRAVLQREKARLMSRVNDMESAGKADIESHQLFLRWGFSPRMFHSRAYKTSNEEGILSLIKQCLNNIFICSNHEELACDLWVSIEYFVPFTMQSLYVTSHGDIQVIKKNQYNRLELTKLPKTSDALTNVFLQYSPPHLLHQTVRLATYEHNGDTRELYLMTEDDTYELYSIDKSTLAMMFAAYINKSEQLAANILANLVTKQLEKIADAICIIQSDPVGNILDIKQNAVMCDFIDDEALRNEKLDSKLLAAITEQLFGDHALIIREELKSRKNIFKRAIKVKKMNGEYTRVAFSAEDTVDKGNGRNYLCILLSERDSKEIEHEASSRADFFARMAHELRTPASAAVEFLDMAIQKSTQDLSFTRELLNAKKAHDMLISTLNRAMQAVSMGKDTAGNTVFDLSAHSSNVIYVTSFDEGKRKPHIAFNANMQIPEPCWVRGDQEAVRVILQNLLVNAYKYTITGSIEVEVKSSIVEDCIHITGYVQDTGIGIDEAARHYIFDKFRQADESGTRLYDGLGLGLSLVKSHLEQMNGDIWVDSVPGRGSVFQFNFLLKSASEPKRKESIYTFDLHGLLVEDNESLQETIAFKLSKLGIKLSVVEDGFKAIQFASETPRLDVIFMDINLPGMDGFETTRRIYNIRQDVIVIALTASEGKEITKKASMVGISEVVAKPVAANRISNILSRYFQPDNSLEKEVVSYPMEIPTYASFRSDNLLAQCSSHLDALFLVEEAIKGLSEFSEKDLSMCENCHESVHKVLWYIREVGSPDKLTRFEQAHAAKVVSIEEFRMLQIIAGNIREEAKQFKLHLQMDQANEQRIYS